ncbi:UNVERIFIED_CONTAM: hypothetical protein PYX00_004895 [Menopon gallinae]|uniref:Ell-associated factor Eaf n=1 Tax=Menopon gallinae TaxID=328185 RepID=A0AAW2I8A7_9NEOP
MKLLFLFLFSSDDFKPASVDINKMATIDVGTNSQITVTVPPNTVFKGSAKPYQKQCIVIVNTKTGEITLEKLTCNIQVKKTRSENRNKIPNAQKIPIMDQFAATQKAKKQSSSKSSNSQNSSTKSNSLKSGGKNKLKTQNLAASLGSILPKHSPLHASPNRKSPNPVSSRFSPSQPPSNSSLPRIGVDDQFSDDWFSNSETTSKYNSSNPDPKKKVVKTEPRNSGRPDMDILPSINAERMKPARGVNDGVGELSDSSTSSSSSSSGDSSDSSSDSEESAPKKIIRQNGQVSPFANVPDNLLKEDLQLSSESGSESD